MVLKSYSLRVNEYLSYRVNIKLFFLFFSQLISLLYLLAKLLMLVVLTENVCRHVFYCFFMFINNAEKLGVGANMFQDKYQASSSNQIKIFSVSGISFGQENQTPNSLSWSSSVYSCVAFLSVRVTL